MGDQKGVEKRVSSVLVQYCCGRLLENGAATFELWMSRGSFADLEIASFRFPQGELIRLGRIATFFDALRMKISCACPYDLNPIHHLQATPATRVAPPH